MKTPLSALALVCLASCRPAPSASLATPPGVVARRIAVTSRSFSANGPIPVDYTCDGADRSPNLTLSALPPGTRSLAVIADDPDAPGGDIVHWVAYNLPADTMSLAEGKDVTELGGITGINGFGRPGYSGPCPPKFEEHSYMFHVYALDVTLPPRANATSDDLQAAMNGHLLGEGALMGTFSH